MDKQISSNFKISLLELETGFTDWPSVPSESAKLLESDTCAREKKNVVS